MAAIVYQTNKKTGVTYAYESTSYWGKEKQQSHAKRTCIGRVDPVTKQIVANRPRKKPRTTAGRTKRGPVPITTAARSFYGATYFLDRIGSVTGVTDDLQTCFPDTWQQILSIVYYLILEDRDPLSRFPRCAATHWHPHGFPISSQRSSELFAAITESERQHFFELQGKRRVEKEYLAYDSTSVSNTQERPYKRDTVHESRRLYLHLYYSPDRALEDEKAFYSRLADLQEELISNQRHAEHEKLYDRYFQVKQTPVRGITAAAKEEELIKAKRNFGYFALLSNDIKDPIEALGTYRRKDLVEKAFDNLKERLNLHRLAVSSEHSLDGKLFVQFVALIYLSYITAKMQEGQLFKDYTLQEVLDEFDVIEYFAVPGKQLQVGEITKRQEELYQKFAVRPPASLQ